MKDSTTDRELLELAAKAAGLIADPNTMGCKRLTVRNDRGDIFDWNPLTDDGDALRLAVKLGLLFKPEFSHFLSLARFAHQDADDYAAVRRAITRTAAEIGRSHHG